MRKLKLQMQVSVDGFVARPDGQLDWMTWAMDEELMAFISQLTDSCDTILLGRKMTEGFITYWENILDNQPGSPEHAFAEKMVNMKKIVFSKTITNINGRNAVVENGGLAESVNSLKKQSGKDIIVYGGAGFVSGLIKQDLIDELNLFINPTAIGQGMRIFEADKKLQLTNAKQYKCGIMVLTYSPLIN